MLNQPVSILNAPSDKSPEQIAAEISYDVQLDGCWRGEIENIKKDGTHFWCQASVSRFQHAQFGSVFVSIHIDITEQRNMLRIRDDLETQLHQAKKMQAIGTLAGGIAHEFNNMLGIIIGNADLLGDDLPEQHQKYIKRILKAGNQAKGLVQQILAFSRASPTRRIPLRLMPLIEDVLHFVHNSFPHALKVQCESNVESDWVLANADEVQQILMNLFSNAIYAMRGYGTIGITLEKFELGTKKPIELHDLAHGAYVKLSVHDDGKGMSADIKERVFDPFFTTKDVGQGTGMGLSLVYGIMRGYKGMVTVDSEPGKGSTFHLFFPLHHIETDTP